MELVEQNPWCLASIPAVPLQALFHAYTLLCLPLVMVMTPMTHLLQLPQNERLALAIALWDSLDNPSRDGALPVDPALCAELDRRWANHRDNPEAAMPWAEVRSQHGIG